MTTDTKRVVSPEQRARQAEYLRRYRHEHPERVKAWRRTYILKAAARMQAESEGGTEHGGD